ncbi:MAG: alpha/beta fold hydrolase [Magnetococcales bacterium]|nr:alpha/beta fold hydrolase [Magnetococcales bacterium]
MKKLAALLMALTMGLLTLRAEADVLVLAHGYLSDAITWERSGVIPILEKHGWQRAGLVRSTPHGVQILPAHNADANAKNRIYTVELPATAPVGFQTEHYQAMVHHIAKQHPKEKLVLVGHSVGGLVSRLALVRGMVPRASALITIATPHLGTPRAEQALDVSDESGMFGPVKNFFGGGGYQTLRYSRGLYIDLVRPFPGSMLFWLNAQQHPEKVKFISVVRSGGAFSLFGGDSLVPPYSQDMNNVPSLRGSATLYLSKGGHELNPGDGVLLSRILKQL